MTIQEKLAAFADLVTAHQKAEHEKHYTHEFTGYAKVVPGKKYAKVDVGTSGRFMVEMDSGDIFGIKAYGVIHRGHPYGNLDTIQDWYWGDYYPIRKITQEAA